MGKRSCRREGIVKLSLAYPSRISCLPLLSHRAYHIPFLANGPANITHVDFGDREP